jgi:tetratricopeptide (TPR) repeat protein
MMAIFFFGFTDSYKRSVEAKMKYMVGEYDEARVLAKEAFDLDPYNRMAISILSQSKISVNMADYLQDAKKYLEKIEKLTQKSDFSRRDKIKIKMMTEVMLGRYQKLNPTVMTDKALFEACRKYYQRFEKIHEELFSK